MVQNLLVFAFSLFLVIKGASLATRYSARLAENFRLSKYIIGFIIVAFISILPEALISLNSANQGIPAFGLGTLFGSNVADLSLIFSIILIYAGRGIKIESKILKNIDFYPLFLILPLILGLNGHYSRLDGIFLIIAGSFFYYTIFKNSIKLSANPIKKDEKIKNSLFLIFAMAILLIGAHFTVTSATELAGFLKINPILIGMLVVGLGTTMPELFFSLKAIKRKDDELAIGDIFGTVLADATIIVGLLAFISPFYFPVKIIYLTGVFIVVASIILLKFMNSGKILSKKEGYLLLLFWICYVVIEFIVNK